MPRYFKDTNESEYGTKQSKDSHPSYGVLGDEVVKRSSFGPEYASGVVHMYHTPEREHPNFRKDGKDIVGATELFRHVPGTLTVNSMYADHRVRPHMMTVMALAMKDHPNAQLVAGSSLTSFSSALSKNAHKRGLVVPHADNPEMQTDYERGESDYPDTHSLHKFTQTSTDRDMRRSHLGDTTKQISHSEVMAGKQFLKQVLRPGATPEAKKQTPKTQSEQLQLPGI